MKRYFNQLIIFCISVFLFTACKKEGDLPSYSASTATVLSLDKTSIAPTPADSNNVVLTLSFTDPMLAVNKTQKVYTLEIDSAGRNFAKSKKIILSPDSLKYSFLAKDLNAILLGFDFNYNVAYSVQFRLTTAYSNNNDMKMSNVVTINATPYKVPPKIAMPVNGKLFIVGGATPGGWGNPVPTPTQELSLIDEYVYAAVLDLTPGSYLLLENNGSWDEKIGGVGSSNNSNNPSGDNFKRGGSDLAAPATAGKYVLTVDFFRGRFTCVPYNGATIPNDLFIVGAATPGDWSNPVPVPSQQFTRSGNCLFEISSLNLFASKMYLLLPVNGSWSEKYGGVGSSNGTNSPLQDDFKQGGSDLISPNEAGNYKISVNFATNKYKLTKL